jgi:hypothetical protein
MIQGIRDVCPPFPSPKQSLLRLANILGQVFVMGVWIFVVIDADCLVKHGAEKPHVVTENAH